MYATVDDLKGRLGVNFAEVYDSDESAALSDLQGATAEIDGALSCRYVVPVASPGAVALLKDWTLTLTEERTYSRAAGSHYAEKIKLRVEQVRKYLEMIRNDQFALAGAEEDRSGSVAIVDMSDPVFTRKKLKGF